MTISTSEAPKVSLALVPPNIAQAVFDETVSLDSFTDLNQLSGILSDDDVSYYLWYNTKASMFAPEFHIDMVSILNNPGVISWIDEHRTVYEKVAAECETKYSIAGSVTRKSVSVDYGTGCSYTPAYSSGVLYLLGRADDVYEGSHDHYYDAALAELSKAVKINDLSQYAVFDKYVGSKL